MEKYEKELSKIVDNGFFILKADKDIWREYLKVCNQYSDNLCEDYTKWLQVKINPPGDKYAMPKFAIGEQLLAVFFISGNPRIEGFIVDVIFYDSEGIVYSNEQCDERSEDLLFRTMITAVEHINKKL